MSEGDNLRPVYDDDQPGEDTYKRGNQYKWTRARKADYEDTGDDTENANKKAYVCAVELSAALDF